MITVSFDLKDKKAARIFGQAMVEYSGESEAGDGELPTREIARKEAAAVVAPITEAKFTKVIPPVIEDTPVAPVLDIEATKDIPEVVTGTGAEPSTGKFTSVSVDENGVKFDKKFCGKAQIPFYMSGRNKGQWKRRQGVDVQKYDAWYAAEHLKVQTGPAVPLKPAAPDTAAAFGGAADAETVTGPAETPVEDDRPTGAGELMKWISEQMNAGNLTQADVDTGYSTAGVTPADLFSGDSGAVTKLYDVLSA